VFVEMGPEGVTVNSISAEVVSSTDAENGSTRPTTTATGIAYLSGGSLNTIKDSHCFLEQET